MYHIQLRIYVCRILVDNHMLPKRNKLSFDGPNKKKKSEGKGRKEKIKNKLFKKYKKEVNSKVKLTLKERENKKLLKNRLVL